MSDPIFIARYVEKDGQVVDADVLPAEMWSCVALTCLSLCSLIAFGAGLICGILLG